MIVKKDIVDYWEYGNWYIMFRYYQRYGSFRPLMYEEDGSGKPEKLKFSSYPSWKHATRNRKQWMKKRFRQRRLDFPDGTFIITYGWRPY